MSEVLMSIIPLFLFYVRKEETIKTWIECTHKNQLMETVQMSTQSLFNTCSITLSTTWTACTH